MLLTSEESNLILRLRALRNKNQSTVVAVELNGGDCRGWYVTGKRERGDGCRDLLIHRLKYLLSQRKFALVVVKINDGDCQEWYVAGKRENGVNIE